MAKWNLTGLLFWYAEKYKGNAVQFTSSELRDHKPANVGLRIAHDSLEIENLAIFLYLLLGCEFS